MTIPIEAWVVLSSLLFAVGAAGVIIRRNALVVLLSVEIMLNAANLMLVAAARMHGQHDGHVMAIIVMAVAASEVVVGLGIVVALSHLHRELDTDTLSELHG